MTNSRCLVLVAVAGVLFVFATAENVSNCTEFYQIEGPQITPCKKEIILQNGQNYRLTCRADTPIEFIQQELPEEIVDSDSKIIQTNYTDEYYEYEAYLDLKNVDRYVIGFYACKRKNSIIKPDVLEQLVAEPNNSVDISYIYIYVNGTDSLFAPMREIVMGKQGYYVAECKASTPDVEVAIYVDIPETPYIRYSPKIGFIYDTDTLDELADRIGPTIMFTCGFKKNHNSEDKDLFFHKNKCYLDNNGKQDQEMPIIDSGYTEFLLGESFSLNCSAHYTPNTAVHLTWNLPNNALKVLEYSNNNETTGGVVYRNITILNANKDYEGIYTCVANSHCGQRSRIVKKKFLENPYLNVNTFRDKFIRDSRQKTSSISVLISAYPQVTYNIYKGSTELKNNATFAISYSSQELTLRIHRRDVQDTDNYTMSITNGHSTRNFTYDIRFRVLPDIKYDESDKTCELNTTTSIKCEILGYPMPNVTWIFNDGEERYSTKEEPYNIYRKTAIFDIQCNKIGSVTCNARNEIGSINKTRNLLVYEKSNGFGIFKQSNDKLQRFSENQNVSIKCVGSKFDFTNVTWETDEKFNVIVDYSNNSYSLVAKLKINNISMNHSGIYVCRGYRLNGTSTEEEIDVEVAALQAPEVIFRNDVTGSVQTFQPINMICEAEGIPRPEIKWYKDGVELLTSTDSNVKFETKAVDYKTMNSSIFIVRMKEENRGEYECVASNNVGEVTKTIILNLKGAAYEKYVIIIAIILLALVILVIYLTCKVKKEKRFRKELAAAGLLYFKEGVTKSINPDLGIDEQAELLPYNEKFEFPAEKLRLGKQLGAGAFGIVYKAEARGIIHAEEDTPVAVKMVKKTADNMYIKALASELKIMVHLGKHVNIVNLLGACTKNVGKRELVVIVEYCRFGNIHNYMQRHREVFIDQFSDSNKEKSFGKVNRGYDSSGSTGLQSDYGTANTQDTDHTFLTNNTNRTCRKNAPSQPTEAKASEGYVQPEWRSNYESDYSYDGRSPRPLTSRDLLAWAFQIARGMEYLASRKVLHGDLAARNILLADDNIVKICDFGLARSIYKNDEYQKKENSLLPVKWLAIECMTDRIFSTQSDVWSFGIVLWELFTLAKTPYPNMSPAYLLHFLKDGHRLEKPAYSDDRIYNLMKRCWEEKPTSRPSFTQLQETLGTFLEDNVRNHYVDLNTAYMDGNLRPEGQEDYLAMVSAPDYNNMVTPSPHHYVNEVGDPRRFFPQTPTKVDEDGYLQMSPNNIFSPKSTGTKFDFDPRKFNSRPSEASSGGSELTPMLTLNNLPRSGSDSDHEGNVSPFPNVCPRIEEEPDEVFDNKQCKNTFNQNAKNVMITNATNPMYITLESDAEKKPIEYVNVVPNGLVK